MEKFNQLLKWTEELNRKFAYWKNSFKPISEYINEAFDQKFPGKWKYDFKNSLP